MNKPVRVHYATTKGYRTIKTGYHFIQTCRDRGVYYAAWSESTGKKIADYLWDKNHKAKEVK